MNYAWSLKSFIPEGSVTLNKAADHSEDDRRRQACGEQIGSFYESVVTNTAHDNKLRINDVDTSSSIIDANQTKSRSFDATAIDLVDNGRIKSSSKVLGLTRHSFFRCAENDDVAGLRDHVEIAGLPVDTKDDYGWTALMCAAFRGSKEAVAYLLYCGANRQVTDRREKSTPLLLANRNGHSDIVKMLISVDKNQQRPRTKETKFIPELTSSSSSSSSTSAISVLPKAPMEFQEHCETCRLNFVDKSSHVSSTVHQFNERKMRMKTEPPTYYHIPESNVGYKIMLKDGWDRERGLGSTGLGIKFPPKTVLKRNKRGLGAEKLKARITHFGPGDVSAVQRHSSSTNSRSEKNARRKVATLARDERARNEAKQKRMEVDLRRQFNELE